MDQNRKSKEFSSHQKNKHAYRHSSAKSNSKSEQKSAVPTVVYMTISDEEGALSIPYEVWADPIKTYIKGKGAVWCPIFKVWKTSRVSLEYIKRDLPSMLTANY